MTSLQLRLRRFWSPILFTVSITITGCGENHAPTNSDRPPSKEELLTKWCEFTSFDGAKSVQFSIDTDSNSRNTIRTLTIKERLDEDKDDPLWELKHFREVRGTWSMDEKLSVVSMRFGGSVETYRFLEPYGTCMLVAGSDLTSVNLESSWGGAEEDPLAREAQDYPD
jgi:hypothetical protein